MSRPQSKAIMGYLPLDLHHYEAVLSLVKPAGNRDARFLDPFAGEGAFAQAAATAWNLTAYTNELDVARAAECIARFGPTHALQGDAERLIASNNAFSLGWYNPPYDHDALDTSAGKRVEFALLRHAWKWIVQGGIVMWCVYRQHLTETAAAFLAKHSSQVDVWGLPGKHQGEFHQIIVVAIKTDVPSDPTILYHQILSQRTQPRPLTAQPVPLYTIPAAPTLAHFAFAPDIISPEFGASLLQTSGAWKTQAFQELLTTRVTTHQQQTVVQPRPGHSAIVIAAGIADGTTIETADYGQVAIRGKINPVEKIARVEVESDPNDPQRKTKKTTIRLEPKAIITLLAHNGTTIELSGDDELLKFIVQNKKALAKVINGRFSPIYQFDYAGLGTQLNAIKLNGKHPLYTAQKHVIGAITAGLLKKNGILLVGQMGTGKTAMGGSAAIAMMSQPVSRMMAHARPDQVSLIVAPPHLIKKWNRELHSIHPNALIVELDRHEQVKAFMTKAKGLPGNIPKIGLIRRDMTKLGCAHTPSVIWRTTGIALWRRHHPTPDGYEPHQRIQKQKTPHCPACGAVIMMTRGKDKSTVASTKWLSSGLRSCEQCNSPLWQEASTSKPASNQLFTHTNPRYRLDQYIKRLYPDRVFLLLWDEVHEAQHGDTGNGAAFGRLAGIADKVLAMTGTPFNGRASSIFNLEYHINPRIKHLYNWGGASRLNKKERGSRAYQEIIANDSTQRGRAESRWVADMGVREQVVEERPSYDSQTGVYTGTSTYERPYQEAPGISPTLVAEILDHGIFFALKDTGGKLPDYEEIAVPVELPPDLYSEYDRTRQRLKDYLIARRWEGDTTFRGAYLQWAMGWPNATFRPYEATHNIRNPVTGEIQPYVVATIPSYGEDYITPKEQALLDLLNQELSDGRACGIFVRQTDTKDIQPRLKTLIERHVPLAKPYILSNTVNADRREDTINRQVKSGVNVLIANPELVKTGLDLLHFVNLIFYEIIFNLSTMMQAAGRAYRLNQTASRCKVFYMYWEGTMEQTAVNLMSRKQRAAKLLSGDVGLTGLDALTGGEGGMEQALIEAIANDDALIDPTSLFTQAAPTELDLEDAVFWAAPVAAQTEIVERPTVAAAPKKTAAAPAPTHTDKLLEEAALVGARITAIPRRVHVPSALLTPDPRTTFIRQCARYLDTVHLVTQRDKRQQLELTLLQTMISGSTDVPEPLIGLNNPEIATNTRHHEALAHWLEAFLAEHHFVAPRFYEKVAYHILDIGFSSYGYNPSTTPAPSAAENDILADLYDEDMHTYLLANIQHHVPLLLQNGNDQKKVPRSTKPAKPPVASQQMVLL